jgi:hypothetical protein
MWEAEITKVAVPGKNICETSSQGKKLGMVGCACHPSDGENYKIGIAV